MRALLANIRKNFPRVYSLIYLPVRRIFFVSRWYVYKLFVKFNSEGLNSSEPRKKKIIISMTSYPARIKFVPYVIASLLNQTLKPDKIILWLADEQFPDKKLPEIFKRVIACGVEIRFCEDLKSHKKYFFAMLEFPDDIIITVDDDIVYDNDIVETLYKSYMKHPDCISAIRVHRMKFLSDGTLAKSRNWDHDIKNCKGIASYKHKATGVGGVLYPPNSVHKEVFNVEAIRKLCFKADDIWLMFMEILNGTKVVPATNNCGIPGWIIPFSQDTALKRYNDGEGGNDIQIKAVLDAYNNWPKNGKTLLEIMREDADGVE